MLGKVLSTKSIGAAIGVAIIIMVHAGASIAQENPAAPSATGPSAPASSSVNTGAGPHAIGRVPHARHHKKKQSFAKRLSNKFEKKFQKVLAPKRAAAPRRNAPAKSTGPRPSDIE